MLKVTLSLKQTVLIFTGFGGGSRVKAAPIEVEKFDERKVLGLLKVIYSEMNMYVYIWATSNIHTYTAVEFQKYKLDLKVA